MDRLRNKGAKAWFRFRMPDVEVHNPRELAEGTKFPGIVVNMAHYKDIRGDVTINHPKHIKELEQFANEDWKRRQNLGPVEKYVPRSKTFDKVLKEHQITPEQFSAMPRNQAKAILRTIQKRTGNRFVKPFYGQQSEGLYSDYEDILKSKRTKVKPGTKSEDIDYDELTMLQREPKKYVAQELLDQDREIRFHTLGGRVIGSPQERDVNPLRGGSYGYYTKFPKNFNQKDFETKLQASLKHRGLDDPNNPVLLGYDLIDSGSKIPKIVDANTESGFIFGGDLAVGPYGGSRYGRAYKQLTGRNPKARSMATGAAVGAGVGLPSALLTHKLMADAKRRKEKN
jgi:hypothetical protein